ncbi:Acetyltransferase (GNAT) domain-containing protein [Clostridium cavendishii DSM 21758]|uniref:Acetyltransferase (GNAT) domain-containing protein n=1 Tax=Clostridium cavendishii DSM 21758 TaxID=1121302 RepID=A0A1M6G8E6_9CLOT|nr:GNAT family N-acetyltransferase [Clostridium cavendishii]SHJ06243.1 Acetyltransferase (GNAT) domain-containing protein [Clostridium cavendishii DSM 21758]
MDISYKFATNEDLEFLVDMRIRDLKMFSNKKVDDKTIQNIREFYYSKIVKNECFTLLGISNNKVIATATIYYYDILLSNENSKGKVGQITNVWVSEEFRKQGIAAYMIKRLINISRDNVGMICLNSSKDALKLYNKIGFIKKDNYLIYNL